MNTHLQVHASDSSKGSLMSGEGDDGIVCLLRLRIELRLAAVDHLHHGNRYTEHVHDEPKRMDQNTRICINQVQARRGTVCWGTVQQ